MTFLKTLWQRINPSQARESVELDPVEQLALRHLLHFGPSTAEAIRREVNSTRVMIDTEFEHALAHLDAAGLIERQAAAPESYVATRKAAVLRDRIPLDPRGVTEFYL